MDLKNNMEATEHKRSRTGTVLLCILAALLLLAILAVSLFLNELRSLSSLEKVDDYGMFRMTYYGGYGFDDFLKVGAESDAEIEKFITKRL